MKDDALKTSRNDVDKCERAKKDGKLVAKVILQGLVEFGESLPNLRK